MNPHMDDNDKVEGGGDVDVVGLHMLHIWVCSKRGLIRKTLVWVAEAHWPPQRQQHCAWKESTASGTRSGTAVNEPASH